MSSSSQSINIFNNCTFNCYGYSDPYSESNVFPSLGWAAKKLCELREHSMENNPSLSSRSITPITIKTFYPIGTRVYYKGEIYKICHWENNSTVALAKGPVFLDQVPFSEILPVLKANEPVLLQDSNDTFQRYYKAIFDKYNPSSMIFHWMGYKDEKGNAIKKWILTTGGCPPMRVLPLPREEILSRLKTEMVPLVNAKGQEFGEAFPAYTIKF